MSHKSTSIYDDRKRIHMVLDGSKRVMTEDGLEGSRPQSIQESIFY